jgi:hypothetical protein
MKDLDQLKLAVERTAGCKITDVHSEKLVECFKGEMVWDGVVHVFELEGHQRAKRCYAWKSENEHGHEQIATVLEIPPVDSAQAAVRAAIGAQPKDFK